MIDFSFSVDQSIFDSFEKIFGEEGLSSLLEDSLHTKFELPRVTVDSEDYDFEFEYTEGATILPLALQHLLSHLVPHLPNLESISFNLIDFLSVNDTTTEDLVVKSLLESKPRLTSISLAASPRNKSTPSRLQYLIDTESKLGSFLAAFPSLTEIELSSRDYFFDDLDYVSEFDELDLVNYIPTPELEPTLVNTFVALKELRSLILYESPFVDSEFATAEWNSPLETLHLSSSSLKFQQFYELANHFSSTLKDLKLYNTVFNFEKESFSLEPVDLPKLEKLSYTSSDRSVKFLEIVFRNSPIKSFEIGNESCLGTSMDELFEVFILPHATTLKAEGGGVELLVSWEPEWDIREVESIKKLCEGEGIRVMALLYDVKAFREFCEEREKKQCELNKRRDRIALNYGGPKLVGWEEFLSLHGH